MNKNEFPINSSVKLERAKVKLKTLKAARKKKRKKKRILSLQKRNTLWSRQYCKNRLSSIWK